MRNWFLARNNCCHDRVRHRCARVTAVAPPKPGLWSSSRVFRGDGPIAIATPTGRLRGESSPRYALVWMGASEAAFAPDDGGRLAPRFPGGFRPRGARSAWLLAGAGGSLAVYPCGFVFRGVRGARGRADGEVRVLADLWGYCG